MCKVLVLDLSGEECCELQVSSGDTVGTLKNEIQKVLDVSINEQQLQHADSWSILNDKDVVSEIAGDEETIVVTLVVVPVAWTDPEIKRTNHLLKRTVGNQKLHGVNSILKNLPHADDQRAAVLLDFQVRNTALTGAAQETHVSIIAAIMEIVNCLQCCLQEKIVMKAVQANPEVLEHASQDMRNNAAVALAAVKEDGHALKFVSDELKNNKACLRRHKE